MIYAPDHFKYRIRWDRSQFQGACSSETRIILYMSSQSCLLDRNWYLVRRNRFVPRQSYPLISRWKLSIGFKLVVLKFRLTGFRIFKPYRKNIKVQENLEDAFWNNFIIQFCLSLHWIYVYLGFIVLQWQFPERCCTGERNLPGFSFCVRERRCFLSGRLFFPTPLPISPFF